MLIIFDLDETLIRYGKKIIVPRQTFHCLRNLKAKGFILGCVTYNCYGEMIASKYGLLKYIEFLQYGKNIGDRSIVVTKLLTKFNNIKKFIYFDDRIDNLNQVKLLFPYASCIPIYNPLLLYKVVNETILGYEKMSITKNNLNCLSNDILIKIISLVCDKFEQLIWFHLVCQKWKCLLDNPILQRISTYVLKASQFSLLSNSTSRLKIKKYEFSLVDNPFLISNSIILFQNVECMTINGSLNKNFRFPSEPGFCFMENDICEMNIIRFNDISSYHLLRNLRSLEINGIVLNTAHLYTISLIKSLETIVFKSIITPFKCGQIIRLGLLPNLKRLEFHNCRYHKELCKHDIPPLWQSLQKIVITTTNIYENIYENSYPLKFQLMNSQTVTHGYFTNYITNSIGFTYLHYPNMRLITLREILPATISASDFDIFIKNMPCLEKICIELQSDQYGIYCHDLIKWTNLITKNGMEVFIQYATKMDPKKYIIGVVNRSSN